MKRLWLVVALAATFFAGLTADHVASAAARRTSSPYRAMDVLSNALVEIQNNYVEPVQEQDLVYGAVEGMMTRLDPHSAFYRPEAYRQVRDEMFGVYEGVGIEPTIENGILTVIAPIADSPAEKAGVRSGDRILSIDGASTRDMPLTDAVRRLRGQAGTSVALELQRDATSPALRLTLVRDRVQTQSVDGRVLDPNLHLLYVRVKSFQDGANSTQASLLRALQDGKAALKGEIRGLVLDLRNNPGGLVLQAEEVADLFLSEGTILSIEGRGGRNAEVVRAHAPGTEPDYPMVVLVNRGTASAAEIVAGALQDHHRAWVLGTQTFGKGSVQTVYDFEDGSGMKLTTARYFTPNHRSIQELGITPDVMVAEAAPPVRSDGLQTERDLKNHLKNGDAGVVTASAVEDDYPLGRAVEVLKAMSSTPARAQPKRATSQRD
jgi:carboxyl-terminal processing protease